MRWWLHPLRTLWVLVDGWSTALLIRSSDAFEMAAATASSVCDETPRGVHTQPLTSPTWHEPGGAHDPDAA